MSKKLTTEEFIAKARQIHGTTYSYEKANYIKWNEKVTIICSIHGQFEQRPNGHLSGKGCDKCARELSAKQRTLTTEEFIFKSNQVHNYTYDYSKAIYENANKKVIITCKLHGDWEQKPGNHLSNKGCPICAGNITFTKEQFIEKAIETHGIKYDYSKAKYINSQTNVTIICPEHGEFSQRANHHLSGSGCSECNESNGGFRTTKPGILYYLEINNGEAYKIGITNHSVKKRYSPLELKSIKILREWYYENGQDAYNEEQRILKKYRKYKYTKGKLLLTGNTELFNTNILEEHKDEIYMSQANATKLAQLMNDGIVKF